MKKMKNQAQQMIDGMTFFIGLFLLAGISGKYSLHNMEDLQYLIALLETVIGLTVSWLTATYINIKITKALFK